MKYLLYIFFWFLWLPVYAENIYDEFFKKTPKSEYNDTLFERIIWHKKVSHLVIESLKNGFYVTLLVIPESPDNYKAKTYPLHYYFKSYPDAFKKFVWLDGFLKSKGILKVQIHGSNIVSEKILSAGFENP